MLSDDEKYKVKEVSSFSMMPESVKNTLK